MFIKTYGVMLLLLFCFAATASAQAPNTMLYQGRLSDDTGNPLVDPVDITFAIYADAEGGAALWEEIISLTPNEQGVFTA